MRMQRLNRDDILDQLGQMPGALDHESSFSRCSAFTGRRLAVHQLDVTKDGSSGV
jgi:hypothetical protein